MGLIWSTSSGAQRIAGACRAKRVHEHEDGFGLREPGPRIVPSWQGDRRRLVPAGPVQQPLRPAWRPVARVLGAPQANRNSVTFSANAGITFHEPFLHRDSDTFAIGMGFGKVSGAAAALDKATAFYTGVGNFLPAWDQKGDDWMHNNCAQGGCYSHISTPNKRACFWNDETSSHTFYTLVGTSSNHPGGVNVGMIDGSVKFVKDTVAPVTWWALATKAGGEVISSDSY